MQHQGVGGLGRSYASGLNAYPHLHVAYISVSTAIKVHDEATGGRYPVWVSASYRFAKLHLPLAATSMPTGGKIYAHW